jgi:hypothetical protein
MKTCGGINKKGKAIETGGTKKKVETTEVDKVAKIPENGQIQS